MRTGSAPPSCINDGDTHNGPSEQVEAKYPLLVESYGLRDNSGGAGRHRGGLGTRQVVRALRDIMFNAQIERVKCRPWGLYDGLSGSAMRSSSSAATVLPNTTPPARFCHGCCGPATPMFSPRVVAAALARRLNAHRKLSPGTSRKAMSPVARPMRFMASCFPLTDERSTWRQQTRCAPGCVLSACRAMNRRRRRPMTMTLRRRKSSPGAARQAQPAGS